MTSQESRDFKIFSILVAMDDVSSIAYPPTFDWSLRHCRTDIDRVGKLLRERFPVEEIRLVND